MPSDWNSTGISKRFMNELKRYCSTSPLLLMQLAVKMENELNSETGN